MIKILHVFDERTSEHGRAMLVDLVCRLPRDRFEAQVAKVGPARLPSGLPDGLVIHHFERRFGFGLISARDIRYMLDTQRIDLVHTWGVTAGVVAQHAATDRCPIVVTCNAPPRASSRLEPWRLFRGTEAIARPAYACSSPGTYRAAAEAGWPSEHCGLIAPGVPADAFDGLDRDAIRALLGQDRAKPLLLTSWPPTRDGGQYNAIWAAALLEQIWPGLRLALPGNSQERFRLERFAASFQMPDLIMPTGTRVSKCALLVAADAFVIPASPQAGMDPLVWAMAAGLPIVASDTAAMCGWLTHGETALLCRPDDPIAIAGCLRRVLKDRDLARHLGSNARAMAAERFSMDAFVENYTRLYENILTGRDPFNGTASTTPEATPI